MGAETTCLSPLETQRWMRIGVLSALALLLGYLESFVPIPIPGVKLGLANIAVLVALEANDIGGACWVALVKVAATGLLFGNPVTLAYSLCGTLLSLVCMAPLSRLETLRLEMLSIVGAMAHVTGQLVVAQGLLGTSLVWYSAPPLLTLSCATGLLCGIVARRTARLLKAPMVSTGDAPPTPARRVHQLDSISRRGAVLFLLFLAYLVIAMHLHESIAAGLCCLVSLVACRITGVTARQLARSLSPLAPIALLTVVAQLAHTQGGLVLARIGPLALTSGTLAASTIMLARLVGITAASVALAKVVGPQGMSHAARSALSPFHRLGMATEGPVLALDTTFALLPLLVATIQKGDASLRPFRHAFWSENLPRLITQLYQRAAELASSSEPV